MAEEVFQFFYVQLVKKLPMDDATFTAKLFSRGLLPGDCKDQVKSKATRADKATYFLDHVIKPSLEDTFVTFNKLLKVMEDSEYDDMKELVKLITIRLMKGTETVNNANKRLKARYLRQSPTCKTDWLKHHVTQYVRLALVEKEDITIRDESLNEITKLTLQGEVDKILKKKKPLSDLKDIFNKPCPRLILIMGAPGEYYKVLVVVI